MSRSPSPAGPWVGLLKHVLDDEDRTRRAERLLGHVTVWLVVLGAIVVTAAVLLAGGPWWASAGAGGIGAASGVLAWIKRHRRHGRLPRAVDDATPPELAAG